MTILHFCGMTNFPGMFMLQQHVILRLQANASPKYVFDTASLLKERIDNWCATRYKRGFKKVAEKRKNWMERLELLITLYFKLDSLTDFTQDN